MSPSRNTLQHFAVPNVAFQVSAVPGPCPWRSYTERVLPKICFKGHQRLPKAANRHNLLFYSPSASQMEAAVKSGVVIRLTQVLFTWWARVSSYGRCWETVPMLLIAECSERIWFRITDSGPQSLPVPHHLRQSCTGFCHPGRLLSPFRSNSTRGANAPSQLITKFLMECFPPGWGPSQRGLQSVPSVKPLWLPEHSRSFRVTADVF